MAAAVPSIQSPASRQRVPCPAWCRTAMRPRAASGPSYAQARQPGAETQHHPGEGKEWGWQNAGWDCFTCSNPKGPSALIRTFLVLHAPDLSLRLRPAFGMPSSAPLQPPRTLKHSCEQNTLASFGRPNLRQLGHCSLAGAAHLCNGPAPGWLALYLLAIYVPLAISQSARKDGRRGSKGDYLAQGSMLVSFSAVILGS